jgi:hypothetical protein
MATTTSDDTFREIQLNGKQLFFLFMAVVVVSVVIFLCGVLVGRGVRAEVAPIEALTTPGPQGPPTRTSAIPIDSRAARPLLKRFGPQTLRLASPHPRRAPVMPTQQSQHPAAMGR